jgi:ABC-2 type transport system permease protein
MRRKSMWSLVIKEFKLRFKERKTYMFMLVMPIAFILLIGSAVNIKKVSFNIHYTDLDGTKSSKQIINSFESTKSFNMTKENDVNNAIDKVKNNKYPVYFVIPKGFELDIEAGKQPQLDVHYDPNSDTSKAFLSALNSAAQDVQQSKVEQYVKSTAGSSAEKILELPFTVNKNEIAAAQTAGIAQVLPGYTVMFAFFVITIMAQAFFKDKDSGMLARLMATPLRRYGYMFGMWIPNFVVVLIQVTVLYAFGHFYFKMPLGNFSALTAVTLLLAFVGTTLGLLLTFISENQQTVMLLVQIVVMGGAALGGLWFPIDILPPTVQKISMIVPQYWIQKSYVSIFARGANLGDIGLNLLVLLIMGIIFSILAYLRYNNFYNKATS